ncbi:hypothetical protein [Allokutzneria albata]|uniref:hypothetical protein n=1 Tax=Allokutzneria albata TaxID=211114 RepID=UPI0012DCDCDA|nr:hypothetical protein [Allokutzneria albata]
MTGRTPKHVAEDAGPAQLVVARGLDLAGEAFVLGDPGPFAERSRKRLGRSRSSVRRRLSATAVALAADARPGSERPR